MAQSLDSVPSVTPEDIRDNQITLSNAKDSPDILKESNWFKSHKIFQSLDAGVSVGSLGLGLSLKTNVTKWADIRVGVDWLPKISLPLNFNLSTYSDGLPTGNFNQVAQMFYDQTGIAIDEKVRVHGDGQMINFKFLVDFYPVPANRHWHITAGFLAGTSKIGKAYNFYDEKPTLVALNVYNRAYEYFTNPDLSIFDVPLGGGVYMDPDLVEKLQERFARYGRMGICVGYFKDDGSAYIMEPSPDGNVTAQAFVNHMKPYLGAGYSAALDKSGRWNLGVDLGVLFWGGVPDVINYDYANQRKVSFTHDLTNLRGRINKYMKIIKCFPVYPVLEIRFSYNIL